MVLNRNLSRRRRLMVDASTSLGEAVSQPTATSSASSQRSSAIEARHYALAAERRHQRKVTDLIPKRPWSCAAMAIGLWVLVGLLNVLAWKGAFLEAAVGSSGTAALGLWGTGTLGGWLAGAMLLAAAAVSWQIYLMRQHRRDDYSGTYRVWIAWTALFLVASLATSVDLLSPSAQAIGYLTGISIVDPAWLPVAMGMVLLGLLLTRYLLEVRRSYGTVAWTVVGWIGLAVAVAKPLWQPACDSAEVASLVLGNALWTATLGWFLGQLTYARFVYLRANGLIVVSNESLSSGQGDTSSESPSAKKSAAKKSRSKAKKGAAKSSTASDTDAGNSSDKESSSSAEPVVESAPVSSASTGSTKASKKSRRKAAKAKAAEAEASTEATPAPAAEEPAPTRTVNASASEKLKQLAAASRARQQAASSSQADDESVEASTAKLSKSQRRKLRRAERKAKRAA